MPGRDKRFYMVREDILPESILKTAEAKEKLARGEARNIQEAVDGVGIARSTFYKYKDGVFALFNAENFEIVNISLQLKHMPGSWLYKSSFPGGSPLPIYPAPH
jgi:chorismate mutase